MPTKIPLKNQPVTVGFLCLFFVRGRFEELSGKKPTLSLYYRTFILQAISPDSRQSPRIMHR
ncbi:TPA_asm: hypothetical protein G0D16_16275 [Salmonella bongori serovar 44:r:-]|uniref:Uncharacterized protein n=1 Tax=Salmonella bongori serovar 44:r:- TaxID=1967585 RepID=A0A702BTE4_SALBN|nr:hypothetical protein [Salmonella bongori serovar 44:r:-]